MIGLTRWGSERITFENRITHNARQGTYDFSKQVGPSPCNGRCRPGGVYPEWPCVAWLHLGRVVM